MTDEILPDSNGDGLSTGDRRDPRLAVPRADGGAGIGYFGLARGVRSAVYERHRNMVIQAKQGNRNPFVDEPGLAARVMLRLGLG